MRATILVPTHDHGPLLRLAVRSALQQTVADLEVLISGDAMDAITREVAFALAEEDDRVRVFDQPKAGRTGEAHRHRLLLEEARGGAVLYLCDDDLWLPEHVEHVLDLLADADFAHALSGWISVDGTPQVTTIDVALEIDRAHLLAGTKTPSLTVVGHTLAAYRRLPHGWRQTPAGVSTDTYMWQQWMGEPWVRAASGFVPTSIHLPSPPRRSWTAAQRLEELERYDALRHDPAWRLRYAEGFLAEIARESAWFWASRDELAARADALSAQLAEVWEDRARLYALREGQDSVANGAAAESRSDSSG